MILKKIFLKRKLLFFTMAMLPICNAFGHGGANAAVANDYNENDALLCVRATTRYEKEFGIPKNLLHAISVAESGRWHKSLQKTLPWPWTVSMSGKAHYFNNAQETTNFVQKMIRAGEDNIDVGCNQINVRHHRKQFRNISHMVDPQTNTAYAASFLKSKYSKNNNWNNAVAHYHSATAHLGSKYLNKVREIWHQNNGANVALAGTYRTIKSQPARASVKTRDLLDKRRRSNMMVYYSGARDTRFFDNSNKVAALSQKVVNQ